MSITDPISNMIVSISNAMKVDKEVIVVPASRHKVDILKVLKKEKVISDYKKSKNIENTIEISLGNTYKNFKRISKPGRRMYVKHNSLPTNDRKLYIVSTAKGVMSSRNAIDTKVGGEILMEIS